MQLSLCNELLAKDGLSLARQCEVARDLGYMGLELAPGTQADRPHQLSAADWRDARRVVEDHGLKVTGLHWLLSPYPELSITDPGRAEETRAVLLALVDGCAEAGGSVLVHGSPGARALADGEAAADAMDRIAEFFRPVAERAERAGVTYCIEPLSRAETRFVNTVAEAVTLVERVGSRAFRTMIDTSAAGQAEAEPVADVIRRWVPTGHVAHVQVNDTNRGGPGMGEDPFSEIVRALRETGWDRPLAVEPFRTVIDGTVTAAVAAATMRACWRACG